MEKFFLFLFCQTFCSRPLDLHLLQHSPDKFVTTLNWQNRSFSIFRDFVLRRVCRLWRINQYTHRMMPVSMLHYKARFLHSQCLYGYWVHIVLRRATKWQTKRTLVALYLLSRGKKSALFSTFYLIWFRFLNLFSVYCGSRHLVYSQRTHTHQRSFQCDDIGGENFA